MSQVMTFEGSVKERLKGIVAELIQDERWDAIVRATVSVAISERFLTTSGAI